MILIHHTGKDPTKGMRGHSSLLAALDAAIEVKAKANLRSWRVEKAKDGEEGQQFDFTLERHAVGFKRDGTPRMSCAVRQTVHPTSAHLPPVTGVHRIAVMAKLTGLLSPGIPMPIVAIRTRSLGPASARWV